ncbi:hypothetical protein F5Y16DRAFT_399850 [Xylariaceae sp. FL0255]|nr:hypothetical protein F5Y16DRAFT_399850 [Xylariaceae sp. FL0255]
MAVKLASSSDDRDYFKISKPADRNQVQQLPYQEGFLQVLEVDIIATNSLIVSLCRRNESAIAETQQVSGESPKELVSLQLAKSASKVPLTMSATLQAAGWQVDQRKDSLSIVMNEYQWDVLETLVASGIPVAWATMGAQHDLSTDPDRALQHGLFQEARGEDPTARLNVLEVGSEVRLATARAIGCVLEAVQHGRDSVGTEWAERDGMLLPRE